MLSEDTREVLIGAMSTGWVIVAGIVTPMLGDIGLLIFSVGWLIVFPIICILFTIASLFVMAGYQILYIVSLPEEKQNRYIDVAVNTFFTEWDRDVRIQAELANEKY